MSDIDMNINSSDISSQTMRNSLYLDMSAGEMGKKVHEWELMRRIEPKYDPEKPPPREHRDKYLFIGAFIGLIVGGISGCVLSRFVGWLIFDIIVSLVVGGIVGVMVGSLIRKHMLDKESRK